MKNNICNIEIALHGYGHQEHNGIDEFEQISRKDAYTKFKKGIKELETLNDDMISTFIPPNNKISKEAYEELRKDNIIISSEGSMFFDYDVSTWNWDTDMIVEEESIIATCEKKFESGDDLCVIMLHPQDFATVDMNHNPNTYEVYTSLLSEIKKSNISVVTFQQYHQIKTESFFTNSTDLYIGMKSYDVHLLQTYLNQLGFVISEEGDGSPQLEIEDFGPKTKDAVIQFQKKYTLSRTDGYVDQETKNKLRELVSPSYELAYQMI
jgi:hypothetical protein